MTMTSAGPRPDYYQEILESIPRGDRLRLCLECGTCSGICPFGQVMVYPPSRLIAMLRADRFEKALDTDALWMCVSCYACTEFCPSQIPLTPGLMARTKEQLLLNGNVPDELQTALANSQRYGNPLGESARKRADWANGIEPEIRIMAKARESVDVLWFVGDYASYHPRVQKASRALAKLMHLLGIRFGILGPEEWSDGDSQRLAGEKGLFEMLAEKNAKAFAKYEFGEIVTADPHAFNALKNEYPRLGIAYPVRHYTELLYSRLDDLRPILKRPVNARVTYHDPCYLGRANGVFDEPRALLQITPGLDFREMPHSRSNSLCCGGGGGGMWLDGFQWEKAHYRLSDLRVKEALKLGIDILAVACPYETPRFEDAVKTCAPDSAMRVLDIAEILLAATESA